jgi:hypothetical protein
LQEIGTDIPEGVAPLRPVLHLKGRLSGRADDNTVEVIPLRDRSVPDFTKAYPGLSSSMTALQALLARPQIPGMKALEKAEPVIVDAAYSLCARVERVESSWLSGFTFFVQFTQEESGDLPNNSVLTYQFLGITKDGAYLVEATFAVSHASLPKDGVYATARKLRESERQLAAFDENSFRPPLSRLKAIISLHGLRALRALKFLTPDFAHQTVWPCQPPGKVPPDSSWMTHYPETACRTHPFPYSVRMADITGQSLPDFLWWRGESLKVAHDHSAQ